MKEQIENNRLREMDIYKAIAIIMVVYGHVTANTAGIYTGFISFVHMPIFYFVSGFFLYKELKKYPEKELIKRKCRRFLVPYFAWSFISFLASSALIVLQKGMDTGAVLDEAVQIFVYSRSVWFFIQLFLAHILFIFIYGMTDKKMLRALINIVVWAILIVFVNNDLFTMWKIKWLYGFLLLGYICCEYDVLTKIKSIRPAILGVAFVICLSVWIIVTCRFSGTYSGKLIYGFDEKAFSIRIFATELSVWACGLAGMATIYLVSMFLARFDIFEILYRIGSYTLDIYVVHMLLIFVIKKIPMPQNLVFVLSFIIAVFFISIPIYVMSKYIFRKIKLYRMIT